jgi:phosphonate transport system substrate-binding protein
MHRRTLLSLFGAGLAAAVLPRARAGDRPVLSVGLGPQQPTQADTRRVWEPIYARVAARVGCDLKLTVANDWAGISVALASQHIDVAQMGPWGYVLAKAKGGARVIDTMLVDSKPTYKAIIVARPDLALEHFPDDAAGLSMQMLDRGSTSGWLVPTYFLRSRGIEPKTFFGRYAEGASAAAAQLATATGQVDLATGWDTHRNTMIRNGTIAPSANSVVWESDPLPNEVVVVRRDLPDDLAAGLQAALADLEEETRRLLPWPYTGFVATTHEPYAVLERMGREMGVLKDS